MLPGDRPEPWLSFGDVGLADPSLLKGQAFIGGQWVDAADNGVFPVHDPATGKRITEVACCGSRETGEAIAAAQDALPAWRDAAAAERSRILRDWYDLILANQEDLARILTAEQGKPLAEARSEIAYGASYFEWFAEEAKRAYGDVIPAPSPDKRIVCIKQPVGVVGCITPWNFPNAMLARKIAPALAVGCTIICKPANETPLSAKALVELGRRAGLPNGVVNLVCGRTAEIGAAITSSPAVRKLTFTGSTAVGKKLMADCAKTVKRTSMELGGNAPFIVFDDADLDRAVQGAIVSKFRNAGQTCVCANRLLVQDGIFDEFVSRFSAAAESLRVGHGFDPASEVGPLISQRAADNVEQLLAEAVSSGAKVTAGGSAGDLGNGFFEPTVLTGVNAQMRIFKEEIFGPIAPVFRFAGEHEAITMANNTQYGLCAYVYTSDVGRVWRVSEALEFGIVGINEGIISNAAAPFGGVKESGQGREGSRYGLDDYLEIKYMLMGGLEE